MFITFEGIEGSGKSTQARLLYEWFINKGYECILTREPGATRIGKILRRILLVPHNEAITKEAELFLYLADRSQHIENVIRPALNEKKIVIVDRFIDSTIAYQGYGRGLHIDFLEKLNSVVLKGLRPDITFLLDIDPEKGLRRVEERNKKDDSSKKEVRFEKEEILFHRKVREGYLELSERFKDRIVALDGSEGIDMIFEKVVFIIQKRFGWC